MADTDEKEGGNARRTIRIRRMALLAVLMVVCTGFTLLLALDFSDPKEDEAPPAAISPVQPQPALPRRASSTQNIDFSKFSHKSAAHARLSCLLCHRREDGGDRPARPGHTPCAGCHSQQFANAESLMCTICHTRPAGAAIKPFPRLKSFGATFNHSAHSDVSCATCHKPSRQGVALSIPSGVSAHRTCYQCHAAQAQAGGRDISSCGTCHGEDPNRMGGQSARAFRVNFSHAEHGRKQGLGCSECHSIRAGAATVSSPQPSQHKASARARSCMSCHNGKRAFGGENFADCKRCHTGDSFSFTK